MGILATILGADNPIAQWTVQNRNLLNQWGAGIGSGRDLGEGFANAAARGPAGQEADAAYAASQKAEAERQEQINTTTQYLQAKFPDLAAAVTAGMPLDSAWNEAMKRSQPGYGQGAANAFDERFAAGQQYGLTGADLNTFALTGALPGTAKQNVTYGTTPVWGTDASGNPVYGVTGSDGSFKVVNTGGFTPLSPAQLAGQKTGATVDAKTEAAARAALPGAQQMVDITSKAIAEVRNNSKGMKEWFSQIGGRGAFILPGSEMGKFIAASSPTNAQAFMQARNMLKGGGQITDYEGRRAEDAISRMQAALDTGDQQQYLEAVADFEAAVMDGYNKLLATAGGQYSAGGAGMVAAPSPSSAPAGTPAGVGGSGRVLVYDPATGTLK